MQISLLVIYMHKIKSPCSQRSGSQQCVITIEYARIYNSLHANHPRKTVAQINRAVVEKQIIFINYHGDVNDDCHNPFPPPHFMILIDKS